MLPATHATCRMLHAACTQRRIGTLEANDVYTKPKQTRQKKKESTLNKCIQLHKQVQNMQM